MSWQRTGFFLHERWHLAALVVACWPFISRLWVAPPAEDPWAAAQSRVAQRLEAAAQQWRPQEFQARLTTHPGLAARVGLLGWVGIAGVVLGCGILWRTFRRARRGGPALGVIFSEPPQASWGIWDAIKIFAWLGVGAQLLIAAEAAILRVMHLAVGRHLVTTLNTLWLDGLAVLLVGWFIRRGRHAGWRGLGWVGGHLPAQLATGLRGYLLWLPLFVVAALVMLRLVQWWGWEPRPQAVVAMLLEESRPRLLWGLMILIAVIGPVAEELVFRGVAYPALRRRLGVGWGLAVSAALFSAAHADPIAFGPIFVLGCVLGWLYEQTGSLIPSMAVHVLHNGVMLLVAITMRDVMQVMG